MEKNIMDMEKCQYYKAVQGLFDLSILTVENPNLERESSEVRFSPPSDAATAV
jgi:hypothetical protein